MSESAYRHDLARAPGLDAGAVSGRWLAAVHLTLLLVALAPLALVEIPALVDYPNHLARMHVLASLEGSPELAAIYAADWAVLPNLAMDAVVPWLAGLMGVTAAGKLFIAATMIAIVGGTLALQRAVQGRIGLASLAVYLLLFNYILGLGFLNYLLGVGLALLLLAVWIASEGRRPWARLVLGALGAVLLFFCHLAAFATYALCVAGYELWRWHGRRPRSFAALVRRAVFAGSQCLPAAALFLAASPTSRAELEILYELPQKLIAPLAPTLFYAEPFDFALGLAVLGLLAVSRMCGAWRLEPALALPAAGLALSVLLVPTWALGNWANDIRLTVPLALLLVAGCRPRPLGRRSAAVLGLAGLVVFGVRMAGVSQDWRAFDRLYGEMRTAAAELEPGARVLPAVDDWSKARDVAPTDYHRLFYHMPALLVLDRPVFVPTLFTAAGRQPLSVRDAYRAIDAPHAKPIPLETLVLAADPGARDEIYRNRRMGEFNDRFAGWPETFDYVLLFDFGAPRNPLPGLLTPAGGGSFFTLYAVAPPN